MTGNDDDGGGIHWAEERGQLSVPSCEVRGAGVGVRVGEQTFLPLQGWRDMVQLAVSLSMKRWKGKGIHFCELLFLQDIFEMRMGRDGEEKVGRSWRRKASFWKACLSEL